MRCRTASRLMSLQMDGVLDPRQAADLAGHLRVCARCRATWASMQRLRALMSHPAWSEPRTDLVARVLVRLPADRRAAVVPAAMPVWNRAGMVVLATMAVLLAAGIGAVIALGLGPEPDKWALLVQSGRGIITAAGKSVGQLVEALGVLASALWQALRWPWLPLLGSAAALAAGLLYLWWRRSNDLAHSR